MGDATAIRLLGPSKIRLGNKDEAHGQHSKTSELFRGVEDTYTCDFGQFSLLPVKG